MTRRPAQCPAWVPALVLALTVVQLAAATVAPDSDWYAGQFDGKAFGVRLVAYPLLMLLPPAVWWLAAGRRTGGERPPYAAFTLVMTAFLSDMTSNSLDLFRSVSWWDELSHFTNWFLLCAGLGLLLGHRVRPAWAVVVVVTGLGAVLALTWELGEWLTFIRDGVEADGAYEDTLGDETLGTLGALVAGLLVARAVTPRRP